jgi:hypothetical protein
MESGQLLFDKVMDDNCSSTVIKAVLDATVNAAKNKVPVDGKMLPIIFHGIQRKWPDKLLVATLEAYRSAAMEQDQNRY